MSVTAAHTAQPSEMKIPTLDSDSCNHTPRTTYGFTTRMHDSLRNFEMAEL
eukprot:COSAG04_NODE_27299_length_284_cov_1.156757_2_plen_50_part_01